jgi:cytochrome c oxidase subunit 2
MNGWLRSLLVPVQGSEYAGRVDDLYFFLIWLSVFFFALIAGLLGWFVWRYRRRSPHERTPHLTHHTGLEVVWSVIPLAIVVVLFFWGFNTYMDAAVSPADALEIHVTAKKWIWQFEYPNGIRTLNEVHVPLGRPVKFVMTSEDVIHSFFVPFFGLNMDVFPLL